MCWTGLWLVTFGSCDEEICYLKYLNYLWSRMTVDAFPYAACCFYNARWLAWDFLVWGLSTWQKICKDRDCILLVLHVVSLVEALHGWHCDIVVQELCLKFRFSSICFSGRCKEILCPDMSETLWVDPDFPPDHTSIGCAENSTLRTIPSWAPIQELFPERPLLGKIDPNDLRQGDVGDCWLLAAIQTLAEYPDSIKNVFWAENPASLSQFKAWEL